MNERRVTKYVSTYIFYLTTFFHLEILIKINLVSGDWYYKLFTEYDSILFIQQYCIFLFCSLLRFFCLSMKWNLKYRLGARGGDRVLVHKENVFPHSECWWSLYSKSVYATLSLSAFAAIQDGVQNSPRKI